MVQIAKVVLIDIQTKDVFKWLRTELGLNVKDAKEFSKNGKTIDFNGEIEKAFSLYNYLHLCRNNSVRLIIDHSYSTIGYTN